MSQNEINTALLSRIQELGTERQRWEKTELLASNNRLYGILTGCAAIVLDYKGDEAAVYKIARQLKLKVNAKTDLFLIIVKLVFGDDDRRRVSCYATVLRKADAADVAAEDLADWITENGGIEAIRLDGKKRESVKASDRTSAQTATTESAPAPLSAEAKELIKAKRTPLLTIPADHLKEKKLENGRFVLMVGVVNDDKSLGVLSLTDEDRLLDAALQQLAADLGLTSNTELREMAVPAKHELNQALEKALQA